MVPLSHLGEHLAAKEGAQPKSQAEESPLAATALSTASLTLPFLSSWRTVTEWPGANGAGEGVAERGEGVESASDEGVHGPLQVGGPNSAL